MGTTTIISPLPAYKDTSIADRLNEEWADIPGLDGLYQVSCFGRVKRLERLIYDALNRPRTFFEAIILSRINKDRNMLKKDWSKRLQANIQVDRQKYIFQISRLVYYCFVEQFDVDNKYLIVSAINGNGLDVYPGNLELLTYNAKNHKSYNTGRQLSPFQTNKFKLIEANMKSVAANSKIVSCYDKNGIIVETYISETEAAKKLNINPTSISFAVRNITAMVNGYYWRFGGANKINFKDVLKLKREKKLLYREKRGVKVTQFDLTGKPIAVYAAKSEAAHKLGISHKAITLNIKGKIFSAGGFLWKEGNHIGLFNNNTPHNSNSI